MKQNNTLLPIILVSVVLFGVIVGLVFLSKNSPTSNLDYSNFIQCLADSGAKFYGASWCPHCANQKAMFGNQSGILEEKGVYVECSVNGGNEQNQTCNDAKIESYPTWDINGQRQTGEIPLETLASLTQCELPVEASNQ